MTDSGLFRYLTMLENEFYQIGETVYLIEVKCVLIFVKLKWCICQMFICSEVFINS